MSTTAEPITKSSHLKLVVVENERRERLLTLEGSCLHKGEVTIWREIHDGLTDHTVEYGTCMQCKTKLRITTWYSRRGDRKECFDIEVLTPNEVDLLWNRK